MYQHEWSDDDIKLLHNLVHAGASTKHIKKCLHKSVGSIKHMIRRLGLRLPRERGRVSGRFAVSTLPPLPSQQTQATSAVQCPCDTSHRSSLVKRNH